MSVERRSNGYDVRWRDGTKNQRRHFATKPAAEKFDRHVKDLKAAGELHTLFEAPSGMRTLADYTYDAWWPEYAVPNLKPTTLENYALQLDKRIIPKWGSTRLRDLRPGPIELWANGLRASTGDPTVRMTLGVMQGILRRAVRDEEIPRNPIDLITKPKAKRSRTPVAITPLHVERIRAHILYPTMDRRGRQVYRVSEADRHRYATLVSVLAYSGPRPTSEALPLRWEQIGEKTITYYPGGKRGAVERQTRLLKPLAKDLREWRLRSPASKPDDLIFGEWPDRKWQGWRENIFKPAAKAAGLPGHAVPRDLRGSFESLLIWSGEDVIRVAREIGHSAKECLDTYGRIFAELDATNRRPIEELIAEARAEVWGVRDVG